MINAHDHDTLLKRLPIIHNINNLPTIDKE